eukprot:269095_1
MFVARFNLPTSTTTNSYLAMNKFSSSNGLVLRLCKYRPIYDVFKLDCSALSDFDDEEESLFFGGNTVLRIASICKFETKWTWYTKYIKPIQAILRMIYGLSCKDQSVLHNILLSEERQQQTMFELVNHVLCTFNAQKSMLELPKYIDDILKYHMSTETIKLDFSELLDDYSWLDSIFTSNFPDEKTLHFSNIFRLFCNSNHIRFLMKT